MSKTVDNRIVQMTFENRDFEKNANTTLSTLDKLGKALKFDGVSSSLKGLQRTADALGFDNITNGLQQVSVKFNALTAIGISALNRLTEKAVDAGLKLVKSLSVDQITKSWSKYDALVSSEQSIMSAISDKINPLTKQKYQIEDVVSIIEKLQWYTDETSYNITQMTSAISNFTSSGVDINTATQAILGISNACADAGVSTQKAESAFIGFSRAIGQGYLSLGTWNMQLKTSGITNSERFKQSLIDAAVALGRLEKKTDKYGKTYYKTTKNTAKRGQTVTAADFTTALSTSQWANRKVILKALEGYSSTVDSLYGLMTDGKLDETSKVMKDLGPKLKNAGKSLKDVGLDKEFDTTSQAIEALEAAYKSLGVTVPKSLKAFKMAQEAISFTQAIEATSDAVSTKWSKTYELIFGNYEESRKLWTKLANEMWYWFAETGDDRNEQLAQWHNGIIKVADGFTVLNKQESKAKDITNELGADISINYKEMTGYEALMSSFSTILESITAIVETVREAIATVFPPLSSSGLLSFTKAFYEFVERVKPTEKTLQILGKAVRTVASIFKYFKDIVTLFYTKALKPTIGPIKDLIKYLGKLIDPIESYIINFGEMASSTSFLLRAFSTLGSIFSKIVGIVKTVVQSFESLFKGIKEKYGKELKDFSDTIKNSIVAVLEWIDGMLDKTTFLTTILDIGGKIVSFIVSIPGKIKSAFANIQQTINKIWSSLGGLLQNIGEGITGFLAGNSGNWRNIAQTGALALMIPMLTRASKLTKKVSVLTKDLNADKITDWITAFSQGGDDSGDTKQSFLEKMFPTVTGKVTSTLDKVGTAVEDLQKKASGGSDTFGKIAKGLLILAAAMFILSKVDAEKTWSALIMITALLGEMFFFMKGLARLQSTGTKVTKALNKVIKNDPTKGLIKIAASILILAVALRVVSKIKYEDMMNGIMGIGLLLGEMFAFIYGLAKLKIDRVTKGLGSLIAISLSLLIVSAAVKSLSKLSFEALARGIGGVGVLILEFGVLFNMVKDVKATRMVALGVSMVAISAALLVMVGVLKLLGSIDPSQVGNALLSLGFLLIELAAFINVAGSVGAVKILAVAAAMLLIAPAFVIFATSIKMLAKLPFNQIVTAVAGIGMILVVLAGFAALISATGTTLSFVALSAAMVLMSASILALSGALWVLGNMDWNQLKKGVVIFTAMIVIIAGLGVIFGSIVLPIIAFAGALGLLGLAFILLGEGLKVLSVALLELNIFSDFIAGLRAQLPSVTMEGAELLIDGINTVADVFRTKSGDFGLAIGNLAEAIVEGLIKAIGGFVAGFGGSLISFIGDGIKSVVNWFKGDKNVDAVKTAGEEAIGGVSTGLNSKKQDLLSASDDIKDEMVESLNGKEEAKASGFDTMKGLLSGLTDPAYLQQLTRAGSNAANAFDKGYLLAQDQHSPSRVMRKNAIFTIQGLLDGFSSMTSSVESAGSNTGKSLADSLFDAISITESLTDEQLQPVIRPILDLTDVNSGLSSVDSMINTNRALSLSSKISKTNNDSQNVGNVNNTTYSPTINVTVNGSKGQNVNQLADIVVDKIQKSLERKAAVWQ